MINLKSAKRCNSNNDSQQSRKERAIDLQDEVKPKLTTTWNDIADVATYCLDLASQVTALVGVPLAPSLLNRACEVIKKLQMKHDNVKTYEDLCIRVRSTCEEILKVCESNSGNIPDELRNLIKCNLVDKLEELLAKYEKQFGQNSVMRFLKADQLSKTMGSFSSDVSAIQSDFSMKINTLQFILQLRDDIDRRIDGLRRANDAAFDCAIVKELPQCCADTRTVVLDQIKKWATSDKATLPHIFWLNGMAGVGKTTVARTIVEWASEFEQEDTSTSFPMFGGSFFFSRLTRESDKARNLQSAAHVIPTLAYQLARKELATIRLEISRMLREDRDYDAKDLETQFDALIFKPLSRVPEGSIVLFVLDGLDECENTVQVGKLLRLLLSEKTRQLPVKIRILITSRPDFHIRKELTKAQHDGAVHHYHLHAIEKPVVEKDIRSFVEHEFSSMVEKFKDTELEPRPCAARDWPSVDHKDQLVKETGSLFIYASVAIRFIDDDTIGPEEQLRSLLPLQGRDDSTVDNQDPGESYVNLNDLYLEVLRGAVSENFKAHHYKRLRDAIAVVGLLRVPLALPELLEILQSDERELSRALIHLHSVIVVPSEQSQQHPSRSSPYIFHPSFFQFITDRRRCQEESFVINVQEYEKRLCIRCLDILQSGIKSEAPSRNKAWSYACRFWAEHLLNVQDIDEELLNKVTSFLRECSPVWNLWIEMIDAMVENAINQVKKAIIWARKFETTLERRLQMDISTSLDDIEKKIEHFAKCNPSRFLHHV